MKRLISWFAVLSLVVAAVAFAKSGDDMASKKMAGHGHSNMMGSKPGSWTGEIVDASTVAALGLIRLKGLL